MKAYRTEMLVTGSVVLAAAGQNVMKLGLMGRGAFGTALLAWPLMVTRGLAGGLALYAFGTLLWCAAVARKDISYLYPLAATNYVLTGLVGHFVLHEPLGPLRCIGILTIGLGIALLARTSREVIS